MRRYLATSLGVGTFLLAGVAAAHPTLYFDNVEEVRARSASYGPLKTGADTHLSEPFAYSVKVPDADGSGEVVWTYQLTNTQPAAHPNNKDFPAWTMLARKIQERLELLSLAYVMTGDAKYLRNSSKTGAIDGALAVASWSRWLDPEYKCSASCLDTAHLTMAVSIVYDMAFDALAPAERDKLRTAILNKGLAPLATDARTVIEDPATYRKWYNGNALRFAGLAVGAAAVVSEAPAAKAEAQLASQGTKLFFEDQGKDGGTWEGQQYGAYAVDNLMLAVDVLARNGQPNLWGHPFLKTLPRFAAAFLGNDKRSLAAFGDSSEAIYWIPTMFALASHGDAQAQFYLDVTKNRVPKTFNTFLWENAALAPKAPSGSGTSLFDDVGFAALRTGFGSDPVVAVRSGPESMVIGHNHRDQASFVISAHGAWLAADPGYRGSYFNKPLLLYTTQSIGHNTVLVDKTVASDGTSTGGGQTKNYGGSLSSLFDGAGYSKVTAAGTPAYGGVLGRFNRRVVYAKPDVVLVFDDISAPAAHAYSFLLHSGADGTLQAAPGAGPAHLVAKRKTGKLDAFLVSTTPLASQTPAVSKYPGAESRGPYAEWQTTRATATRFAAAFVPAKVDAADAPQAVALGSPQEGLAVRGAFGVEIAASRIGGTGTTRTFSTSWTEARSIKSDGELFAAGFYPDGALKRALVQGGTSLVINGIPIVTLSKEGSMDAAVQRSPSGCATLRATDVPSLEGAPYTVKAAPKQVFLNGKRVAFAQNGDKVTFPSGTNLGPGCADAASSTLDGEIAEGDVSLDAAAEDAGGCSVPARGHAPFAAMLIALAALVARRFHSLRQRG